MVLKKKKPQFRPCKIPRYLPGSVPLPTLNADLKLFNEHRYKCFTAQTKLDNKPPKFNPYNYVNQSKLMADAFRLKLVDKENKELLKKINLINRTMGKIDSYNPHAYDINNNWYMHIVKMKEIEKKNKQFYRILKDVKSGYSRKLMSEFWASTIKSLECACKFPLVILEKEPKDKMIAKLPSISNNAVKVSLPECFLEFSLKDGIKLGKVIIQLYYDFVPITVQNFLTLCDINNEYNFKNCLVHRIIPGKYIETGDITMGNGRGGVSIYGKNFFEENHVLQHTKPGVLSMVRVKNQENNSQFCVTFDKMETLDHKYVVFGRIIKGIDNLFKIQGYGRKVGKPLVPIVISNCGKL